MDENSVARKLEQLVDQLSCTEEDWESPDLGGLEWLSEVEVRSFSETGVLTDDAGFVLKVGGREFQVSVVRSK